MANKIEAQIEKIEKAKETIAKKQNTIAKKCVQIDKKKALLEKTCDEQERYWIQCDIDGLVFDLERLEKEIEQKKETLANHEARLVVLQEQEAKINAMFDVLKDFIEKTVEAWDAYDMKVAEKYNALSTRANEIAESLGFMAYKMDKDEEYQMLRKQMKALPYRGSDIERIHAQNMEDARALVLNLFVRTEKIVGTIEDYSSLIVTAGNGGFATINGVIKGTDGSARVQSVLAGGWNIQRLHIRTLVHAL